MVKRPRVAVVFGGISSEHGISCLTAASVTQAIDRDRYDVVGLGITRDGAWVVMSGEEVADLQVRERQMPEVSADQSGAAGQDRPADQPTAVHPLPDLAGIDVAFSLLHGPFGEDGTIQGMFEMLGVRYVGAGVLASAAGMDKHYMKVVMAAAGIPVGPWHTLTDRQWRNDPDACLDRIGELTFPVFVKPARAGSSFGINKVSSPRELTGAIEFARRYDPRVIVEEGFVGARELECGVLETPDGPRASVVAEIVAGNDSGFYDFEAKYLPGAEFQAAIPADLPEAVSTQLRELAVTVFEALGCEGLGRVDFFLTEDGELYCNEINTMPGFTTTSMYPKMWAATGTDYATLVDTLIQQGLNRPLGLR